VASHRHLKAIVAQISKDEQVIAAERYEWELNGDSSQRMEFN
jgi:hypothetical protein